MKELLRSADPVRLSFLEALLADAGIEATVLDRAVSTVYGSSLAQRLVVADDDYAAARRLLVEAGEMKDERP